MSEAHPLDQHLTVRVLGPGRAGSSLWLALDQAGVEVELLSAREDLTSAAEDARLVVLAVGDEVIAEIARQIRPGPGVIAHLSGVSTLAVLAPHPRRASLHPLVSMPTPEIGAARLNGAWFATAGDPEILRIVQALKGRSFNVPDDKRGGYHATACIASNHLVALLGQVERLADDLEIPHEAFYELAVASLGNANQLGAAEALTGPAARGDNSTVEKHRSSLPPAELATYDAMVAEVRRLALADKR